MSHNHSSRKLTHVSPNPDPITVEPRDQSQEPGMKPKGFWYEVDGDWRRWDTDDHTGFTDNGFLHAVELGNEKLLRITSVSELDDFDATYHVTRRVDGRSFGLGFYDSCDGIRWAEVAATYDGIEIAPYQWGRRLDGHLWYYGWDCASGVIWRPKGIIVTPIGPVAEVAA